MTSRQAKISTCLWYDTEAELAAEFYVSLIPDSRILARSHYGTGTPMPEGSVMLVRFNLAGTEYSALNGGPHFAHSCAASIVLTCTSQDEIDRVWQAILDHGGASQQCGWIADRWGLSWQIIPAQMSGWMESGNRTAIDRMMNQCMRMTKLDLAALSAAFDGRCSTTKEER